jgi:hypothetical protein
VWHGRTPKPKAFDKEGKTLAWIHVFVKDGKRVEEPCSLTTQLSERDLVALLMNEAKEVVSKEKPLEIAVADMSACASPSVR